MRSRWALRLPARLALTYGLLVTAALLLVVGLTIRLTHSYLTRELDYHLQAIVNEFREGPGRRVSRPEHLAREARAWLAVHPFAPDETALVRIHDGGVLSAAGGLDLRSVQGARDLLDAAEPQWRILGGTQSRVRAVAVPIELNGTQIGTLVAAASKTRLKATEAALISRVVIASVAGLLLSLVLGYTAVRQSVRPLSRMLQQIDAIQATGDLSRRINYTGPADEVGRLAAAFDRMLMRLQETFRAQQRFVSDASHELRTPLAVAKGHLELLQQEIAGARVGRSLAVAAEELDRMARIVNDLLLLARLDEGITLQRRPVDVELVLREALLRSMLLAPRRTTVDVEPGLHAIADPNRLLQVLTNLITNAAQHGGEQVTITLTARRDDGRAVIHISDSGPGIAQEDLPHVFDRFYRGARARQAPGGVGLGLAIASSLVKAMKGEISVTSRPGFGTTFAVTLPLAQGPPVAVAPAAAPPPARRASS